MNVCNSIALEIESEFLDLGKEIPSTWRELPGVKMIRDGRLEVSVNGLNIYNKFAIVPEAPEIREKFGIPREYVGMRLFLIQRDIEPTGIYSYVGRAAILIGPETADPKERRIMATFLQEGVAKAMISQIKGFDPVNQPVAFEKDFMSEIVSQKEEVKREIIKYVTPENVTRVKKRLKSETEVQGTIEWPSGFLTTNRVVLFVVATLGLFLSCFLWRRLRTGS